MHIADAMHLAAAVHTWLQLYVLGCTTVAAQVQLHALGLHLMQLAAVVRTWLHLCCHSGAAVCTWLHLAIGCSSAHLVAAACHNGAAACTWLQLYAWLQQCVLGCRCVPQWCSCVHLAVAACHACYRHALNHLQPQVYDTSPNHSHKPHHDRNGSEKAKC